MADGLQAELISLARLVPLVPGSRAGRVARARYESAHARDFPALITPPKNRITRIIGFGETSLHK